MERTDFGGNPPHIEYALTERGMLLLPLLESLRQLGLALKCNRVRIAANASELTANPALTSHP